MNKTQKGAWSALAGSLFFLSSAFYMTIQIGIRKTTPSRIGCYLTLSLFLLITGIVIYFSRKKQSPVEPDSDERDKQIQQKAWLAAFVSAVPLFLIASVVPQFFIGMNGSIPVWSLPIVTVLLFYIVLLVYSIAVLIQYNKGEDS